MGGKTDPQIALEILTFATAAGDGDGHGDGEGHGDGHGEGSGAAGAARAGGGSEHLDGVIRHMETELAAATEVMRASGRVMPGVEELLPRLHEDDGVVQSVLTGNTAANAEVKLTTFGLDRWLDLEVGAYGSDHADRRELVPIALDRVERLRGRRFSAAQVWVVGDTPNDLACARAAGARCLLVGTGNVPLDELRALEPDAVLPDLADVGTVHALLTG
jgi:phosphoglycolate phosphatase-like HAD superfamily hydrolase